MKQDDPAEDTSGKVLESLSAQERNGFVAPSKCYSGIAIIPLMNSCAIHDASASAAY